MAHRSSASRPWAPGSRGTGPGAASRPWRVFRWSASGRTSRTTRPGSGSSRRCPSRAPGTIPAATAAPDPPLEPPVIRAGSHGFPVRPHAETRFVPPAASSCWFVFPTRTGRPADAAHHGSVLAGDVPLVGPRASRRLVTGHVEEVLDRDRHAGGSPGFRPNGPPRPPPHELEKALIEGCQASAAAMGPLDQLAGDTCRIAQGPASSTAEACRPSTGCSGGQEVADPRHERGDGDVQRRPVAEHRAARRWA